MMIMKKHIHYIALAAAAFIFTITTTAEKMGNNRDNHDVIHQRLIDLMEKIEILEIVHVDVISHIKALEAKQNTEINALKAEITAMKPKDKAVHVRRRMVDDSMSTSAPPIINVPFEITFYGCIVLMIIAIIRS